MGEIDKYLVRTDALQRFDQRNDVYKRAYRRDPVMKEAAEAYYYTLRVPTESIWKVPGRTLKDYAYAMGSYYVERMFARGHVVGNFGLLRWEEDPQEMTAINRMKPGFEYEVKDPGNMSKDVKKAAKKLGASEVGVCELNPLWVYATGHNPMTHEDFPIEIDFNEYKYAIVFVVEMDYEVMRTSPGHLSYATVGYAYSRMAYVAGQMAHFIKTMGYKAIPSCNDTALNIPLAVDAGLGQLGRNGLLITPQYGPRVRIAKILTNLPLSPDKPISFGVPEFCNICNRCAEECPGRAIMFGDLTDKPVNISTSPGVFKWPIDSEKCFMYWGHTMQTCSNCIRVCPFNKPAGWLHDTAKFIVRNASWLDSLLVRMDKLFGYGKRATAEGFWAD
jgi:epoxyqueuosine reductase